MKKLLTCSAAVFVIAGGAWGQVSGPYEDICGEAAMGCNPGIQGIKRLDGVEVIGLRTVYPEEITSSVSIIGEEDLLIRNAPNVVHQLRAVPGVGVSHSGGSGALTQVRLRGAEANHTLVLLNGIEVSDPTTGETDFGLLTGVPAARIDVLRGEQSAIYGSDAIGGVVALRTSTDAGLTGAVEGGSFDTARGELGYTHELDGGSISGAVSGFTTRGVDTAGLDGEKDGSSAYGGALFGSNEIGGGNWNLSGLALYRASEVETDPDTDFDGRLNNADRVTESDQFILGASLWGETGPVDHIFRASYNSVTRENSADGQFTDETKGERTKFSWSPSVELADAHQLSGLIDYESEDYQRASTDTLFGDPNQSQTFNTVGFAGEYRAELFDGLNVSASARHDLNDDRFDNTTTWRIGAAYAFDFDARLRASVGTGVKNPTFTELFGFFPAQFVGNPNLTPEESLSWEIGWDQSIGEVSFSASYFEAELEDEIFTSFFFDAASGAFGSTPANRVGKSERSGLELAARWQAIDSLSINGSASFIDSQNDSGADEIRVPSETASLGLDWRSNEYDGLRAGLALDYVGEQLDTDFATFQNVELDAYTLVSATIEIPFSSRLAFTLRGDNLLDEDAIDVVGFNTPGAGVYIGFKLR